MLGPKRGLAVGQRLLHQRTGLVVAALHAQQRGEVVDGARRLGVLLALVNLVERDDPLHRALGLNVALLMVARVGYPAQQQAEVVGIVPQSRLGELERLGEGELRGRILAPRELSRAALLEHLLQAS